MGFDTHFTACTPCSKRIKKLPINRLRDCQHNSERFSIDSQRSILSPMNQPNQSLSGNHATILIDAFNPTQNYCIVWFLIPNRASKNLQKVYIRNWFSPPSTCIGYMEVSWNGGTPSYQPFLDAIFPNKNHPDMGYPHGYGNPHMEHINWYITYSVFTGTTPLFGGVHSHGGTQIAGCLWWKPIFIHTHHIRCILLSYPISLHLQRHTSGHLQMKVDHSWLSRSQCNGGNPNLPWPGMVLTTPMKMLKLGWFILEIDRFLVFGRQLGVKKKIWEVPETGIPPNHPF